MTNTITKPIAVRVDRVEALELLRVLQLHGHFVANLRASMGFHFFLCTSGYITIGGSGLPWISRCAGRTVMGYTEFMEAYVESYNDN